MAVEEFKIKQIEGKSEYFKDILDKIPNWIFRWGNLLIFSVFLIICLGLSFFRYPEVMVAEVLVTTNNPPIEVYSRTNGRIRAFLAKDQEKVMRGDWVIELNNASDSEEVKKLIEIFKKLSDSNFIESIERLTLPSFSNLGDVQNNYSDFRRSVEEYKLFIKLNPQKKQLGLNQRRDRDLRLVKERLISQKELLTNEADLVKKNLDRYKGLNKKGVISDADLETRKIDYLKINGQLEAIEEKILGTGLEITGLNKENTDLQFNQNDTYFRLRANVLGSYNIVQVDLKEWQNKYIIVAPITGILNLYEIRSTEEFISNEQKVFTINGEHKGNNFALVKLPVSNSGKLKVNQETIIKIDNYPYQEFGMLEGVVESFTSVSKEGFYSVKISLPNQLTTSTGYLIKNNNNLSGSAEIIVADYSAFERLFNFLKSKTY